MNRSRRFATGLFLALPLAIFSTPDATAEIMKMTSVVIAPFPEAGKEVPLRGLSYDSEQKEISSVRFEVVSGDGEDPVKTEWIFTGSNSTGGFQRVHLTCVLLDAEGKELGDAKNSIVLSGGAEDQEETVKMKVKAEAWQAAKKVRIHADFATLR